MTDRSNVAPARGQPVSLAPGLTRIVAPNPSAMTHWGTNTYILGDRTLCIIDPGPDHPDHLAALLALIGGRPVSHILVTHSHLDHSALSRPLAQATGAPVLAFGDSLAGRSVVMTGLAGVLTGGGEGLDLGFRPDQTLPDGAWITGPDWQLTAVHTPGHLGNHVCLRWGDALFSGDQVMGWASSLVSPPDGDLTDFMRSCHRLRAIGPAVLYPGHGDPVFDAVARIDWLLAHRTAREAQIRAQLATGPATIRDLTDTIYAETALALHPAAARNVFAHLIDLASRNLVQASPTLAFDAVFSWPPAVSGA